MKKYRLLLFLFTLAIGAIAQDPAGEKIRQELLAHPQEDTFRVNRLLELVYYYKSDSIYQEALAISRKTGYLTGEAYALTHLAFYKSRHGQRKEGDSMFHWVDSIARKTGNTDLLALMQVYQGYSTLLFDTKLGHERLAKAEQTTEKSGNKKLLSICRFYLAIEYANGHSDLPKGMEYYLKSIQTAEQINYLRVLCSSFIAMGQLYKRMGDPGNSDIYYQRARETNKQLKSPTIESQLLRYEGNRYEKAGRYPEALATFKHALESAKDGDSVLIVTVLMNLADVYTSMDSLSLAFHYGFKSASYAKKVGDNLLLSDIAVILSKTYLKNKMADSAIYYARLGYDSSGKIGAVEVLSRNAEALSNAYVYKKDFANAYTYHLLYISYRDSALNTEVRNKSAVAQYNSDLDKKQVQISALNQQKKTQQNYLYIAWAVLLLIAFIAFLLLKSNRQKQKANKLLQQQKLEIEDQRDRINKTLGDLQQTQAQLIQSEKMASLGELTAGIAHEIQNPLNFVNNFSEVNTELLEELKSQKSKVKSERDEQLEEELLNDISDNEKKINHHGKRADAIVKGMLQHSQRGSGTKELTDINALAEEWLRLSYHGFCAKDISTKINLYTDFDNSVGKINIIPQEIGRVFMNLYNNAFYAASQPAGDRFNNPAIPREPSVWVATKKIGNNVVITVSDNGPGIPHHIVDKIFQPFFTTKPTGQGTGLGLSLSYDIIKSHGGEIKVESQPAGLTGKEEQSTIFRIFLPI